MNKLKVLLEEILPFYFLVMIFVIMFTAHIPTMFELYIVYAFAFAVSLFNTRLYESNKKMSAWGDEVMGTVNIITEENKALRQKVNILTHELEECKYESNSVSTGSVDVDHVPKESEEHI